MRKALLMLILAAVSCSAMAEWVRVGSNETANLIIYADPDTIHRTGDIVRMLSLLDYSVSQRSAGSTAFPAASYLSVKSNHEYDCKKNLQRILAYYWYSQNMGNGTVVLSDETVDDWYTVNPHSTKEILLNSACGKH